MRDVRKSMNLPALGLLLAAALLLACGGSDKEKAEVAKLAETCSINSNCETPLVCAFAHCHEECAADRDCPAKERCVKGLKGHVCQLDGETKCVRDKECLGTQVCGVDGECRDECKLDTDCSKGQTCANSGECASTDPTKDTVDESGNIVPDVEVASAGKGGSSAPKAGSSGSGKAGAGGMSGGGSAGKLATAGAGGMSSSACAPEATPNEDRDHAMPYENFGTDIKYCLQTKNDVDFYELKTPATPAQGGFYVIKFRLKVAYYTGSADASIPYTLRIDYTGVPDENEPNDVKASAAPLSLGTPIHGYMFAGFENSTSIAATAWEDWFKIPSLSGMQLIEIALTDLASDIGCGIELYDSKGVSVDSQYEGTQGASVVWTPAADKVKTAGDYYLKVVKYTGGTTYSDGSTVPAYLTQPYTLTVTPK